MPKYILDPNGDIKKLNNDNNNYEDDNEKPYTNENLKYSAESGNASEYIDHEKNNIKHNDFINVFTEQNTILFDDRKINTRLLNKIQSNHSYENGKFLKEPKYENDSYKTMYSYNSTNSDSNLYAQEFEIRTGYRFQTEGSDNVDTADLFAFIIDHIANVAIQFAFIEVIKLVNRVTTVDASGINENFHLKLGNYTYTEFEVLTRYINKVLNYPNDRSTILDRICAYLIGLIEYIAINKTIDYDNIIKHASNNEHVNKFTYTKFDIFDLSMLNAFIVSVLQMTIETLLDDSNNKRIILLMKKFMQEKHWINNVLYKHKTDSELSKFFDYTNYYNFKFTIERMNIGLKIINRYIKNSNNINDIDNINSNRLLNSKTSSNDNDNFNITNDSGLLYNWSNKKSFNSNNKESTTKLRGLPSALSLHHKFIFSVILNKKTDEYLNIQQDIKQNFFELYENNKRIDSNLVKEIENSLEAEYMPFYFHDLRTNELLAFHAFIDNISDAFSPEYTSSSGFGRIDDVKAYVKTTRTINLSFTLAATSENDHDYMWYQINKLIAMVYPQWSEGIKNKSDDGQFTFPFTQVPTASPLIRLRVGDIIKSNYSRTNLSRLHGTENTKETPDFKIINKPKTSYELLPGIYSYDYDFATRNIKIDHPVNIEISDDVIGKYQKVTIIEKDHKYENKSILVDSSKIIIKKIDTVATEEGKPGNLERLEKQLKNAQQDFNNKNDKSKASFDELITNPSVTATAVAAASAKAAVEEAFKLVSIESSYKSAAAAAVLVAREKNEKIIKSFESQDKINNPITGAYESGMGRGLAGFITNIDMNYNESTWETSRIGSKAPIFVKITMGFSPIHDIAPGLDHNGMIRAPVYNVGRLNNQFFGDPHDGDDGLGSGLVDALKKYNMILKNEKP